MIFNNLPDENMAVVIDYAYISTPAPYYKTAGEHKCTIPLFMPLIPVTNEPKIKPVPIIDAFLLNDIQCKPIIPSTINIQNYKTVKGSIPFLMPQIMQHEPEPLSHTVLPPMAELSCGQRVSILIPRGNCVDDAFLINY